MKRAMIMIACAVPAAFGVLIGFARWAAMAVPPEAVALREKLPYVSLADRLAFEVRDKSFGSEQVPVLSESGLERLNRVELVFDSMDSQARSLSLKKLHSSEVASFIRQPGNGITRMGRLPTPEMLDYDEPPPISLAGIDSGAEDSQSPGRAGQPMQDAGHDEGRGVSLPTASDLDHLHLADQIAFTDPWTFGNFKSREQVAGFVPHAFTYLPIIGDPANQYPRARDPAENAESTHASSWRVVRLELVSLLKFDEPAVYVSDNLPRMQDLAGAKTRPLTVFEKEGLASLRAGADVVSDGRPNEIRMLGSLRAAKQCLECHSGQRGKLLGAFTYQLQRRSSLPEIRRRAGPAT